MNAGGARIAEVWFGGVYSVSGREGGVSMLTLEESALSMHVVYQ